MNDVLFDTQGNFVSIRCQECGNMVDVVYGLPERDNVQRCVQCLVRAQKNVVTQVRKGDSKSYAIYHRSCFESGNMSDYDDPQYWTYRWDSEIWNEKPLCAICRQVIQRKRTP